MQYYIFLFFLEVAAMNLLKFHDFFYSLALSYTVGGIHYTYLLRGFRNFSLKFFLIFCLID